jgi:predicted dienelactone hydrolase
MMLRVAAVVVTVLAARAACAQDREGRFPVGITQRTFIKTSVTTGAPRVLDTIVWYPAVRGTGTAEAQGLRDARIRRGRRPLVVFSHGACGQPEAASYLMRALAADGIIAAAPPHPGHTRADGNVVCRASRVDTYVNRVPDLQFVVDSLLALSEDRASPFAGRLRRSAIGVSGTSFGGFTALFMAQREPRVRAVLSLVPGGIAALDAGDIGIPAMVIGAELDGTTGIAAAREAYDRLTGPRFLIELLGGGHLSVVDDCAPLCGTLAEDEGHRLVVRYARPFFRRYLARRRVPGRALVRAVPGVELTVEPRAR